MGLDRIRCLMGCTKLRTSLFLDSKRGARVVNILVGPACQWGGGVLVVWSSYYSHVFTLAL